MGSRLLTTLVRQMTSSVIVTTNDEARMALSIALLIRCTVRIMIILTVTVGRRMVFVTAVVVSAACRWSITRTCTSSVVVTVVVRKVTMRAYIGASTTTAGQNPMKRSWRRGAARITRDESRCLIQNALVRARRLQGRSNIVLAISGLFLLLPSAGWRLRRGLQITRQSFLREKW